MNKPAFYKEAFTNPTTDKEYNIPQQLINVSTKICNSYGIKGICDPMYIVNLIALELELGDGKSNFYINNETWSN